MSPRYDGWPAALCQKPPEPAAAAPFRSCAAAEGRKGGILP